MANDTYTINQWDQLRRFLEDGRLELTNNGAGNRPTNRIWLADRMIGEARIGRCPDASTTTKLLARG